MSGDGIGSDASVLGGALDLGELFPGTWMCEHTEYEDIDAFIEAGGGVPATRESDRRPDWNEHVASSTAFDDWSEMVGQALDDYRERRTGGAQEPRLRN